MSETKDLVDFSILGFGSFPLLCFLIQSIMLDVPLVFGLRISRLIAYHVSLDNFDVKDHMFLA